MKDFLCDEALSRAVPACKNEALNREFAMLVRNAASLCDFDWHINSAFRSVAYEKSKGREGTSSHCKGLAVDVAAPTSSMRYHIVRAALAVGISRIGIGRTFVHLDADLDKTPEVIFHYYPSKMK